MRSANLRAAISSIVNELRKIRSVGELVTKARVGARVLLPRVMRAVDKATAAFSGPRHMPAPLAAPQLVSAHAGGDGA